MPTYGDLLFGNIAVLNKVLPEGLMVECLRQLPTGTKLQQYAVQSGLLSKEKADQVEYATRYYQFKDAERVYYKLVLKHQYVTEDALKELLRIQKQDDRRPPLFHLMLKQRYVTPIQHRSLASEQRRVLQKHAARFVKNFQKKHPGIELDQRMVDADSDSSGQLTPVRRHSQSAPAASVALPTPRPKTGKIPAPPPAAATRHAGAAPGSRVPFHARRLTSTRSAMGAEELGLPPIPAAAGPPGGPVLPHIAPARKFDPEIAAKHHRLRTGRVHADAFRDSLAAAPPDQITQLGTPGLPMPTPQERSGLTPAFAPTGAGAAGFNQTLVLPPPHLDSGLHPIKQAQPAAAIPPQAATPAPGFAPNAAADSAPMPVVVTSADADGDPWIGQMVGAHYRIVQKVGEGGMGSVYKAQHELMRREVAIKLINPELITNEETLKRFQREIRAMSSFQNKHTVEIYDAGELPDGSCYMAMEFLRGNCLTDLIDQGPVPAKRTADLAMQILSAIEAAHANKIVHRDLKPDNIMVIEDEEKKDFVKVMDFGVAKILEEPTDRMADGSPIFVSMVGTVTGTPQYMSPEQASGDTVDHRSDLYSIGCILYEMLTGRLPFESSSPVGYIGQHISQPPPPFKERNPDVDVIAPMEELVMKLLQKIPGDRFQTAQETRDEFCKKILPLFSKRQKKKTFFGRLFGR